MLDQAQTETGPVDSPRQSRVFAVVVTYNIGEAIHRCFDSVKDQVGHVLIIDNGSEEVTLRELNEIAASDKVTLILNERNEGVAHAYNQAVQWAKGRAFEWILTLDHDSEATPGMVAKLVEAYAILERSGIQNTGLIGANPYDVNGRYFAFGRGEDGEPPLEDEEVISSGSLIPLQIFDKVGLFNEDIFIYYVDTDFCRRLTREGFRVYVCLRAVLLHREGCKTRHKFLWRHAYYDHYGKTARYYLTRNAVYMIKRHDMSLSDVYWLVRRLCKDHLKILVFDRGRIVLLWYSLRGLMDGLRGKVGPLNSGESMGSRNVEA
jgi:rhamnosyltransferase